VQGVFLGTVISFVKPLAGQPTVGEPLTAVIKRPMTVARDPPAMTADDFVTAISAVLLLGADTVAALLQLELGEFGS
jgi:hypothetical protein